MKLLVHNYIAISLKQFPISWHQDWFHRRPFSHRTRLGRWFWDGSSTLHLLALISNMPALIWQEVLVRAWRLGPLAYRTGVRNANLSCNSCQTCPSSTLGENCLLSALVTPRSTFHRHSSASPPLHHLISPLSAQDQIWFPSGPEPAGDKW